ncbi:MAG: imidazole glycerol phosphate synthase subunit HisH [Limisphaerales bacterium]
MIALLDYGSGNLPSVHKALIKVGANVRIAQRPDKIGDARAMVLPGVGAFDDCMNALRKQELLQAARDFIQTGKPFSRHLRPVIRRCLKGVKNSIPAPPGWGFSKAASSNFQKKNGLKIPQIGWNQIEITKPDCPLYRGIENGSYVYFVHSFYPQPKDESIVATRTEYGDGFCILNLARQCFRHAISS